MFIYENRGFQKRISVDRASDAGNSRSSQAVPGMGLNTIRFALQTAFVYVQKRSFMDVNLNKIISSVVYDSIYDDRRWVKRMGPRANSAMQG